MRYVRCKDIHGVHVQEVLDEFNERRAEFGIADADIISISVRDAITPVKIYHPTEERKSKVIVSIFYWTDDKN